MIKLEISGVHYTVDAKVTKYVRRKIGRLEKYLPRHARESCHGEVVLIGEKGKRNNRFTCEATLTLPQDVISAKDSTINMYAAIDIVEAKLKSQLGKYKTKNQDGRMRDRLWRRFRRLGRK